MKLYDYPMSPNARRVRIFLAEKGLEVPRRTVDLAKAEQREAWYRAVNPFGRVPALELDDGGVLYESMAICRHLENEHPEPPLLGRTPEEQVRVEMAQRGVEFHLFAQLGDTFWNTHPLVAEQIDQVPRYGALARERARRYLALLDRTLEDRPYVAGDAFSVADITALCAVDFGAVVDVKAGPELGSLARWHARVSERPSAQA